mgnify:CR=1 FL=1
MRYVDEFRDRSLARRLAAAIAAEADTGRDYRLMEFCGGHTHAIFRYGVQDLMPANLRFVHGPGCPVCVLPVARIDQAIAMAKDATEIMVVGGANLYAQALPIAGTVYLTLVDAEFEGDTHFPDIDPSDWTETERERHPADETNRWPYVFTTLVRAPRSGPVA